MDSKKVGKWVIGSMIAVGGLFFALPILTTVVWNLVSLAIGALALGALYFLLPALAEGIQQVSYWLWDQAIRQNPTAKLWRELTDFGKEILSLEENSAEVIAARCNMEAELKKQRQYLDAADVIEWQEQISNLKDAEVQLAQDREDLQKEYKEMERIIRKEEANWKLAKAQGKAADALQKAGQISGGSAGTRVAMSEIQDRLAKSKARLEVIRSKRAVDYKIKHNTVDTTAVEIKPQPVLTNQPSPTLTQPVPNVTALTQQVKANTSKLDSLLDKL